MFDPDEPPETPDAAFPGDDEGRRTVYAAWRDWGRRLGLTDPGAYARAMLAGAALDAGRATRLPGDAGRRAVYAQAMARGASRTEPRP